MRAGFWIFCECWRSILRIGIGLKTLTSKHAGCIYGQIKSSSRAESSFGSSISDMIPRDGDFGREREAERTDMSESRASGWGQLNLMVKELAYRSRWDLSRENLLEGVSGCAQGFVVHPENRWYRLWTNFILVWAVYSSFFTPLEFGFFVGLPKKLYLLDIAGQFVFLVDIILNFLVAYRNNQTYRMVYSRNLIAIRYLRGGFLIDLLGCLPWDAIYKVSGRKEAVRYLLWIRLGRVRKVTAFFQKMEKDIRINYLFTRIAKLISVELYCTHTAACIFYYLATTLPPSREGYTWIGSLQLGDYSYKNFREIDLLNRYITSLYFAILTMATVGYGDIHAVNNREMIFIIFYVSFDMILGAYLIGNMTALIVKGSKTERYRDKLNDLNKYMNGNNVEKDARDQIKRHLKLQYECRYAEADVLQDIPISIRAKISQNLYMPYIEEVPLFKGCSREFINQIVIKVHEEFFLPGEVIIEQGNAVDQIYFVCDGLLEEVGLREDGSEETLLLLHPVNSFGEIAILCNIPQPYSVRVRELCRLLRIDKQSFSNIMEICFLDSRIILRNLLEGKYEGIQIQHLESEITLHIGKKETELALRVNSAAFHGELCHLKSLVRAGADLNKTDYDGRSPLHLAAMKGYEDIVYFLIQEGMDVNVSDKFRNSPLLEAIKNGHDRVASLLVNHGALLKIDEAGAYLCRAVVRGDSDFLKRLLSHGIDPNSRDYDDRTALHVAAAEGSYSVAKLLLEAGAYVLSKDRWGSTPLDISLRSGAKPLIQLFQDATNYQFSNPSGGAKGRLCSVFPFHPWEEERKEGVFLWVPNDMEELIMTANDHLKCNGCYILGEDAAKITDTGMISDSQKLYLVN